MRRCSFSSLVFARFLLNSSYSEPHIAEPSELRSYLGGRLVVGSGRICPHDFRFLGDALLREVLRTTGEQSVSIDRSFGFFPVVSGQSVKSQLVCRGETLPKKYERQDSSSKFSDPFDDESKAKIDEVPIVRMDH